MENQLILIVEDETDISRVLAAYFEREGFRTVTASDGAQAMMHFQQLKPDLIVLDVGLPKLSGFEVLTRLRAKSDVPVLMATAMAEDLDKLSALRLGADDYVVKPYNPMEVVARTHAILRRGRGAVAHVLNLGPLHLSPANHIVKVGDVVLDLTLTEYRVIAHLMTHPGQVYSRMDLIDASMPDSGAMERTMDSHVSNLRRKLSQAGAPGMIRSVRGIGYCLDIPS